MNGAGQGAEVLQAFTCNALPHNACLAVDKECIHRFGRAGKEVYNWRASFEGAKVYFLLVPNKESNGQADCLLAKGFKCTCSYGCPAKGCKYIMHMQLWDCAKGIKRAHAAHAISLAPKRCKKTHSWQRQLGGLAV